MKAHTFKKSLLATAIGASLAGRAGHASAAGFQLMEQNASGLGNELRRHRERSDTDPGAAVGLGEAGTRDRDGSTRYRNTLSRSSSSVVTSYRRAPAVRASRAIA